MLPDIRKGSGIRKTVQIQFGGYDARPAAADGTFCKTEGMTARKSPIMAACYDRMEAWARECENVDHMIGFVDALIWTSGTLVFYNGFQICSLQSDAKRLVRFGYHLIAVGPRQIIDLSRHLVGRWDNAEELPLNRTAGSGAVVWDPNDRNAAAPKLYEFDGTSWELVGSLVRDMEKTLSGWDLVFRDGSYQGEAAEANTIEMNPDYYYWQAEHPEYLPGAIPKFTDYFKAGDAVTIRGITGEPETEQTLIIREITATEIHFYDNALQNYVGRYTVGEEALTPDLYQISGFYQPQIYETNPDASYYGRVKRYFTIPDGITMTKGDYIEYTNPTFWPPNPTGTQGTDSAFVTLYHKNGTAYQNGTVVVTVTYSRTLHPDGVRKILELEPVRASQMLHNESGVSISLKWPEHIEGVFEDSNRLWGWEGKTLRASKLGDPSNWNFFDGTSEDSWALEMHRPGPITGGISAHGYPTFFMEDRRIRIYGDRPSSFQTAEQDCHGVKEGCGDSLCILDGALYYWSQIGMMQDSGAVPVCISDSLGVLRLQEVVSGAAGTELRVNGKAEEGSQAYNLVLDVRNGIWILENSERFPVFAAADGRIYSWRPPSASEFWPWLVCFEEHAPDWADFSPSEMAAGTLRSSLLETNDYTLEQPNRKRVHRIQIRVTLAEGAALRVAICYDGGEWLQLASLQGSGQKKSFYLPVLPRRCDHFRLRFAGSGTWELESLALEVRTGSPIH